MPNAQGLLRATALLHKALQEKLVSAGSIRSREHLYQLSASAFALGATLIGLAGMLAWLMRSPRWIALHESVPMVFSTALCLTIAGIACLLQNGRLARISPVLGIVVATISLTSVAQSLTGLELKLGIEQLLVASNRFPDSMAQSRMSPNTALCASLFGIGLVLASGLKHWKSVTLLLSVSGGIVVATGLSALLGYIFSIEAAYAWGESPGMAINTALGFSLLGSAQIVRCWRDDKQVGYNGISSSLLTLCVILISLDVSTWLAMRNHEQNRIQQLLSARTEDIAVEVGTHLQAAMDALERMARRNEHVPGPDRDQWEADAAQYLTTIAGMYRLVWFDLNLVPRQSMPASFAPLASPGTDSEILEPLLSAARERGPGVAELPSRDARQPRFLIHIPSYQNGRMNGVLVGYFRTAGFLASTTQRHLASDMWISLMSDRTTLSTLTPVRRSSANDAHYVSRPIDSTGVKWHLEAGLDSVGSNWFASLPNRMLVSGTGVSALILLAAFLLQRSRRLKRRVGREEGRFRQVVESAPDALLMVDRNGRIQMMNRRAEQLFGYDRAALLGRSVETLMPGRFRSAHANMRETYHQHPKMRAMGDGATLYAVHRSGREIPVQIGLSPIDTESGPMALASIVDVSEREQHMKQLSRSNEELESFAHIASHDLKAPLQAVDKLAHWLAEDLEGKLDPKSGEYIRLMRARIDRMSRLLDDLLSYSRIGRVESQIEPVDTEDLVCQTFDMYASNTPIELRISGPMPQMMTARAPLELIFRNLFGNAIKHHDRDHGLITVSARDAGSGGEFIEFDVADDGPGIKPEYVERAFAMFSTLRRRDEIEGSGMGLAMIARCLDVHDGSISVLPNSPRGALFRFRWPKRMKTRVAQPEQEHEHETAG